MNNYKSKIENIVHLLYTSKKFDKYLPRTGRYLSNLMFHEQTAANPYNKRICGGSDCILLCLMIT